MLTDHPNVQAVNAMTKAIFDQDHAALTRIFTDDVVFHLRAPLPSAGDHRGVGGMLDVFGAFFEATDGDIQLEQRFCVGTDGWAAEFEHATLGRNGAHLGSDNVFVYRFDGDRIAELWMYVGALPEQAEAFFA